MPNSTIQTADLTHAPDLIVRGHRVVTSDGERAAAIHIRAGSVAAISAYEDVPTGVALHDADNSVVMPGLVDTHVHINEPGRTEWEGFSTATRAAAAGGVTTLIEMPLNSIPATTTAAAYREKLAAAAGKLWVDTGFWGGVVRGNSGELRPLWESGVFGFKCFLVPSGVDEFAHVAEPDLREAMPVLAELGAPLLVHAELPGPIADSSKRTVTANPRRYATWLHSRPRAAEVEAIELMLRLCREFGMRVHIVHLSASDAISRVHEAKTDGLPVSVETCPHYLTFAAEEIADGATEFKCAPPIRERENREKLWEALGDGTIDFIASDHSPCPPGLKSSDTGDFLRAWGGIAGLELSLPVVWTGASSRGYAVPQLSKWLCSGPARLAGLENRKGAIAVGYDADLVIWNPDSGFLVEPSQLHQRHKISPYAGQKLSGVVETTFLRGRKIYDHGEFSPSPLGQVLRRGSV
jgi:allantoinase